jgi:hypothetical protein
MAIMLGLAISLKNALQRTATISAAADVPVLINSIDRYNTAMARAFTISGTSTTTGARVEGTTGMR